MLIIADGWDELSRANRSKVSFLYNLLFGRLLPSASVLLTSRPSASAPLHDLPSVDRLVEVVGFNEENIKQYIESEFEQFPEKLRTTQSFRVCVLCPSIVPLFVTCGIL